MTSTEPSPTIAAEHARLTNTLPFHDSRDHELADRGFLGTIDPMIIRNEAGDVVWDGQSYDFLGGEAPTSVNPSLWRQSTLVAKHGLYEVVDGIYQVRGFDLSNVTFVESDSGVIVIDPLISAETAAAALALYRQHRGHRRVLRRRGERERAGAAQLHQAGRPAHARGERAHLRGTTRERL